MQLIGLRPNLIIILNILLICATFVALKWGMDIHGKITRCGFLFICNCNNNRDRHIQNMEVLSRQGFFHNMYHKEIISWNAMIIWYESNGCSKEVINALKKIEYVGINPNNITFVTALFTYSLVGLVKEGYQYLKLI